MVLLLALACRSGPAPKQVQPLPAPAPVPSSTAARPTVEVETVAGWTGTAPFPVDTGTGDTGTGLGTPPFTLVDVTAGAGIDYLHWVQDPLTERECEWGLLQGAGAAAGDYDADGDVDLFATRFLESSLLFRNRGDGTFDEVGAAAGVVTTGFANGALWFDVDSDADLDLFVTRLHMAETNLLFVNDGAGGFTEEGAAWGLALPAPIDRCSRQYSASAGDFDIDGDLDLHVAQWNNLDPYAEPSRTWLLRNEGFRFADVTTAAGVAVPGIAALTSGFTDFDRDGWADLWIVADFAESKLFLNNQDGTFRDATSDWGAGLDANGMGGTTGDWDGDGDPEWFITSIMPGNPYDCNPGLWGCSGNVLYRNERTLFALDAAAGVTDGQWAWGAAFTDVDRDGDLDLFHAAGELKGSGWPYGPDKPRLFLNDGAGVSTDVAGWVGLAPGGDARGVLAFDADGDGDPELFQTANGGHPTLWRNEAPPADWLRVQTRGRVNRFGVGARVEVERVLGGPVVTREVHANSGFLGNNPIEADFGLGVGGGAVDRVRVVWPGGAVTEIAGVAANQVLVVEEP